MDLTAAQMTNHTAAVMAHEIGHSLGMEHDFKGQDETNLKPNPSGKGKCKGIMDYIDSTGGWSECSNADIKKYLNGLKKNCLLPIGVPGRSTEWQEGCPDSGCLGNGDGGNGGTGSTIAPPSAGSTTAPPNGGSGGNGNRRRWKYHIFTKWWIRWE